MSTAKGDRLKYLHDSRRQLYELPCDKLFEIPGRPNVLYTIKDYSYDKVKGAAEARQEAGFLFRAFETGQIGPRRLARMLGADAPRNATIHEYLDWTVTAQEAKDETEYDFSGFRLILLYPRERNIPPPGGPLDPWPGLQIKGRPLSAATIRAGPGYLEVPFVATHENKRGRGFGRCIVEAMEDVARALKIGRLLLCSTIEEHVKTTWKRLGFVETSDGDLEALDVRETDLVHMQNTVQMHKYVPPPRRWRSVIVKHEAFMARTYVPLDKANVPPGMAGGATESFAVGMTESAPLNGGATTGNGGGGTASSCPSGAGDDGGTGDAASYPPKGRPRLGTPGGGGGGDSAPAAGVKRQREEGGSSVDGRPQPDSSPQPLGGQQQQQGAGPGDGQQQQQQSHSQQQQRPRLQPQPSEASSDVLVFAPAGVGPAVEAMEVG